MTTTAAPRIVPVRLPIPPKITTAKTVSENEKPNTPGVASRSQAASIAPAKRGQRRREAEDDDLVAEHVLAERLRGDGSSRMPFSTRPTGDSPTR